MESCVWRYCIELFAPLGKRTGVLEILLNENEVCGTMKLLGSISCFSNGSCFDGIIAIRGTLETFMYSLSYELSGILGENEVILEMRTSKGTFPVSGTRLTSHSKT